MAVALAAAPAAAAGMSLCACLTARLGLLLDELQQQSLDLDAAIALEAGCQLVMKQANDADSLGDDDAELEELRR